ncbi:MAG: hypothetical protein QOJ54_2722 [Aliidongia sp.]|nr:hypothetical protein [Aliidongia sp.]
MRRYMLLSLAVLALSGAVTRAAPPVADPDWPCRQRLVPALTAATFWNGTPLALEADWRAEPRVAAEVAALAPRDMPVEDGIARLGHFADGLNPVERATLLPELFAGLVDETNRQRGDIIVRIKDLARRQHDLGATAAKVTAELRDAPAGDDDAKRREEIRQRRDFIIRSFEETERTMRYACEVPVDLEARLGGYARAVQSRL